MIDRREIYDTLYQATNWAVHIEVHFDRRRDAFEIRLVHLGEHWKYALTFLLHREEADRLYNLKDRIVDILKARFPVGLSDTLLLEKARDDAEIKAQRDAMDQYRIAPWTPSPAPTVTIEGVRHA